ncbi:hypothetical protein CR970_00750 [Candidatus Saccharibacteria bacterium]|nr:MAG: hypothetical protein CR970_00750 [Candidatus Saccharibacteria bacterium]
MAKSKQTVSFVDWLRTGLRKVALAHFVLLAAYAIQTIVLDAWDIVVPEVIMKRWLSAAALLVVASAVWYIAHNRTEPLYRLRLYTFAVVIADIIFAAYNVYIQRGVASKYVALFAIPLIVSALLLSRAALYLTAFLSTAAYVAATVLYFTHYFNEAYKTELYAEVGFYCAGFFVLAMVLGGLIRFGGDTDSR